MITVVGLSPSIDITYLVEDFRVGEIHRPREVVRCAGGKSLNAARAARRQGADVALTGIFGGASGRWLASELAGEGVSVDVVDAELESRTCVSVASAGALTEVYEYAPPVDDTTWRTLLERLAVRLADRPGWLIISGSSPQGLAPDVTADLVDLGHRHGVNVALDAAGEALQAALPRRPELVKINRAEAAGVLDAAADAPLSALATRLADRTGGRVILTDGAAGATGVEDGRCAVARLPDVVGHYPVGSGDSFLGGAVAQLDRGAVLAEALRVGMACGAANALVPGAAVYAATDAFRLAGQVRLSEG